ncbi:MAG: preprotein translocase subunit YajC [Bacteroidales bacterium]
MNILLLDATTQAQPDWAMQILPFVGIILVFYFFMMRPQMKKQKELRNFRSQLKKGDKVVTNGGIFGEIHSIDEGKGTVTVTVSHGVDIVFASSTINPANANINNERR